MSTHTAQSLSAGADSFLRTVSRQKRDRAVLSWVCLTESLVILGLALACGFLATREPKVMGILINGITGESIAVDLQKVDAMGEKRLPVEVYYFVKLLLNEAYSFTSNTARSNLENVLLYTTSPAAAQVKSFLDLEQRRKHLDRGYEGLCGITNLLITQKEPLTVQARFSKKVLSPNGEMVEEKKAIAQVKLKLVLRSVQNPHGLTVIEYSESLEQEQP